MLIGGSVGFSPIVICVCKNSKVCSVDSTVTPTSAGQTLKAHKVRHAAQIFWEFQMLSST
jgi:hypothetical protein